ncbi:glycoside hydrolase family 2 TIM barrel-domain containing protein [Listeria costaricensis]|uniref:glycoside hydrolase family 2 TIM barrel-domain containing protein n=1 Tax=Listeria costaricensis TaxID=2026604 RepID=UPI000C07BD57|nr:glycoside hydrolase family 2 TIM barrel-domain containing protein [Listeria costaricensis]
MRKKRSLNDNWLFHLGELGEPMKTVKKAAAIGGLTSATTEEGMPLPIGKGGDHFLRLISQGQPDQGLRMLAGTDLETKAAEIDWQNVDLPHDWKQNMAFTNDPALLMSGSKEEGVGYYRKTFDLPEELARGQRLILRFEGVMRKANVWLNGMYLGENLSGYTEFDYDVTEMLQTGSEGANVLLVKVDTTTGGEGWWYEGAGIYRNVDLLILPELRLDADALYLFTKQLGTDVAEVGTELTVQNDTAEQQAFTVRLHMNETLLLEQSGETAASGSVTLAGGFTLHQPDCWTPENPHLYAIRVELRQNDRVIDEVTVKFGVRTVRYDETGFYLNGESYLLKGVCEHQDFAGVGTALSKDLVRFKLNKIKAMGANSYRSAHHFASRDLLSLCDELGVIVMNENRILESSPWRLADFKKMVTRSRMHPSICFWSIANEEIIGSTSLGARMAKRIVQTVRAVDYERLLVSAELLNPEGLIDEDYIQHFDVVGVNYPEAGVMGGGLEKIKENYPHLPLMSAENASYFSTRGIYQDNAAKCQTNNFGSLYSMVLPGKREPGDPGVGGTARPEEVMAFVESHPYMGGAFLWTAFDYAGEPSPFGWPGISSQFGILDMCGFEKDYYYYYQSKWTEAPMIHVMPHWNGEALDLTKEKQEIRVFSNCHMAELFVNGESQGRQLVAGHFNTWHVPYVPGELLVVGFDTEGMEVARDMRQTAGELANVQIRTLFEGEAVQIFALEARDEADRHVPTSHQELKITARHGRILGVGNGDPIGQNRRLDRVALFSGKAIVVAEKGTVLKVSADEELAISHL